MKRLIMAGALALAGTTAQAYTPEGGTWFNPDEPGTGVLIEIQDNTLVAFVYAYEESGDPIWYVSAGELDGNTEYDGDLQEFVDGTCVGCEYRENEFVGAVGRLRIEFDPDDPTHAEMTWSLDGGPERTTDIERYLFALGRAEDGAAPVYITKMMGEWQATLDFSFIGSADVPYYGEVLVFDFLDFDNGDDEWYFEGCRPENSLQGFCTDEAFEENDAAGFFDESVDRHVIIVTDTRDQFGNPFNCLLYDVRVDTNAFQGGTGGSLDGATGGIVVYRCGTNPFNDPNAVFLPVRGHRTASRTFTETGEGPSKAAPAAAATKARKGLPYTVVDSDGTAKAAMRHIPLDRIRALEARIGVQHSD